MVTVPIYLPLDDSGSGYYLDGAGAPRHRVAVGSDG